MSDGPATPSAATVERTRLAWRRTTLSASAVVVLAASRVVTGGWHALAIAACALMALLWLAVLGLAHHRISALSAADPTVSTALGATPARLALLVCALSVVGTLLALGR